MTEKICRIRVRKVVPVQDTTLIVRYSQSKHKLKLLIQELREKSKDICFIYGWLTNESQNMNSSKWSFHSATALLIANVVDRITQDECQINISKPEDDHLTEMFIVAENLPLLL